MPGCHCYATAVASETVVMGSQGVCGPQAPGPDQVRICRGLLPGGPPALLPGENSALCMHNLWKYRERARRSDGDRERDRDRDRVRERDRDRDINSEAERR
jgi:hypothetical protein